MCLDGLEESLASIKSGRASPTIFNDVLCRAYGEEYPLGDLATTVVQGSNVLLVKVFDESVKEEVLKGLQRSEFELSCQMEGKDIRVKLGTSRKEHIEAGLKKVKEALESLKKQARDERQTAMHTLKKLSKVLPESESKLLEQEFNDMVKKTEADGKKACEAKEQELQQG